MSTLRAKLEFLAFPFLVIAFTTLVFGFYIYTALTVDHLEALQPYMDWTAARPFVYRVFTTVAIQIVTSVFFLSPEASSLVVSFLSLLGFAWAFWYLAIRFVPEQRAQQLTLAAPLALCPFFLVQRHIYDFPTLLLFTLALALLAHEKMGWYLVVLVLASFCKETSALLILFFAFHFRGRIKNYFRLLLAQIFIFGMIRVGLMWTFRNNVGQDLEFHLQDHIYFYSTNPEFSLLLFGFVFFLVGAVIYRWNAKPKFLRDAVITIALPLLVLFFFFGFPFELRIFFEAFPMLVLLCVPPSWSAEQPKANALTA